MPYAGMNISGSGSGNGMQIFGDNDSTDYNSVINTGSGAISYSGNNTVVRYNLVDTFAYIKDDAGGVYTSFRGTNRKAYNNIILHGIGAPQGTDNFSFTPVYGVYIDDLANNVEVFNNTVSGMAESGLMMHNAPSIYAHNNTLYNNKYSQIQMNRDMTDDSVVNEVLKYNIYFSLPSGQPGLFYRNAINSYNSFGVSDSNYYVNQLDTAETFRLIVSGVSTTYYGMSGWRTASGQDANSTGYFPWINTAGSYTRFEYNATSSLKTIPISQIYYDVFGNKYSGVVMLKPYTSVILLNTPLLTSMKGYNAHLE